MASRSKGRSLETASTASETPAAGERRRVPRVKTGGSIEIRFNDPMPVTVVGELVDSNLFGFRVRHDCNRLLPGLEIQYSMDGGSGKARVVWTHVLEGWQASGIVLLPNNDPSELAV